MRQPHLFIVLFFIYCAAVLVWWYASGYIPLNGSVVAGAVLLPYSLTMYNNSRSPDGRYALLAAGAATGAFFLPSRTLHLFVVGCAAFYAWEMLQQRSIRGYALLLLILVSALLSNWILVFGFPIRLWLSEVAAVLLSYTGADAYAEGNLIHYEGVAYAVDPACLGLVSVQISFLFLTALLMVEERRSQSRLPAWLLALLFAATAGLVVLYNLWRILLLCLFDLAPGSSAHELGGVLSLLLYVLVPMLLLVHLSYRYGSHREQDHSAHAEKYNSPKWRLLVLLPLAGIVFWLHTTQLSRTLSERDGGTLPLLLHLDSTVYRIQHAANGITQYYGDSLLIYTKPIIHAFGAEHSPMICWQGSGFTFESGNQAALPSGAPYYTGVLIKKNPDGRTERLYTAWWYDNGRMATISQWVWRQAALRENRPFWLVNVTAESPERLQRGVGLLLRQ
jgi:exosortase N